MAELKPLGQQTPAPAWLSPPTAPRPGTTAKLAALPRTIAARFIDAEQVHPVRQVGFLLALGFVFLRTSFLHELITYKTGVNTYLVLLTRVTATLAVFGCGGLRRIFSARPALWWMALTVWMILGVPFSYWKKDSLLTVFSFMQVTLPMMLVVAGLAYTLKDCVRVMQVVALGAFMNVLSGRLFSSGEAGRLSLFGFGTIGNANDFALHLVFVLPFCLFLFLQTRKKWLKLMVLVALVFGLYWCAATASRGGLIAMAAAVVFMLLSGPTPVRMASLTAVPILAIGIAVLLPKYALERYTTILEDPSDAPEEAIASRQIRTYLLQTSLNYTLAYPVFGVGLGQFPNFEGGQARAQGKHGRWQVTHNTYTQVSSEAGIPALIFYLAAIVSTFRLLRSLRKLCHSRPQYQAVMHAAFCLMVSLVGFCTGIFFLSLAYTLYLPLVSGIAIAFNGAVRRDIALEEGPDAPGLQRPARAI